MDGAIWQCSRLLVIMICVAAVTACSTTRTLSASSPERMAQELSPGDAVVIHLKEGRRIRATVVQTTDTELVTKKARYRLSEVERVEYERVSAAKTAGGVSGAVVALLLIGFLGFANAFGDAFAD